MLLPIWFLFFGCSILVAAWVWSSLGVSEISTIELWCLCTKAINAQCGGTKWCVMFPYLLPHSPLAIVFYSNIILSTGRARNMRLLLRFGDMYFAQNESNLRSLCSLSTSLFTIGRQHYKRCFNDIRQWGVSFNVRLLPLWNIGAADTASEHSCYVKI